MNLQKLFNKCSKRIRLLVVVLLLVFLSPATSGSSQMFNYIAHISNVNNQEDVTQGGQNDPRLQTDLNNNYSNTNKPVAVAENDCNCSNCSQLDKIVGSNLTYNFIDVIEEEINRSEGGFFEEHPAWNMPDISVVRLTVKPDRVDIGEYIVITASIANLGTGRAEASNLTFMIDDALIGIDDVPSLAAGEQAEARIKWRAEVPGRHFILAQLEPGGDHFDGDIGNNRQIAALRVSREENPQPELDIEINLDSPQLNAGESHNITLNIRNPSFVDVRDIKLGIYIDSEIVFRDVIGYLAGGEEQNLEFAWKNVYPGGHVIEARLDFPEELRKSELESVKSWYVVVPNTTHMYYMMAKDKWVSLGPSILTDGAGGLPTGSVGRIDCIAFHPADSKIIYAGSPFGGLWKTTNGGDSWTPLTDKLPLLGVGAVAVDPKHPDIVYFSTGGSRYGDGIGIFKSIDGGKTWSHFASKVSLPEGGQLPIKGASRIVIRYPVPGKVLIYAATDVGVIRYESNDPWALKTIPSDWYIIKSGTIMDMAVNPKDNSNLYVSVLKKGLYSTLKGEAAKGDGDWKKLQDPFPWVGALLYTLDIYWGSPNIIYSAISIDDPVFVMVISRSENDGKSWSNVIYHKGLLHGPYNPFIRVSPTNKDLIYFGGIKLYKMSWGGSFKPQEIVGVHDDMHGMEWSPFNPSDYYICCDGGIWRCTISDNDICVPRNNDLRAATFFDFDASKTNPKMMIGGTQDCGTILYQGSSEWRIIHDGDGLYSLIAPGDKILYSQEQGFKTTRRCDKGGACYRGDWQAANNGLPDNSGEDSWITLNPKDPTGNYLLSQGDQVYRTTDGGKIWKPIGPADKKGDITRVVVQPETFTIFAGTSLGQIWYLEPDAQDWHLLDEHPNWAKVWSMSFAPTNYKILYIAYQASEPKKRLRRLVMNDEGTWSKYWIADNLPSKYGSGHNIEVQVITGDGWNSNVAYVGTADPLPSTKKCGTVFRGETSCDGCAWNWKRYDDGLPNVPIKDLLVDPTSKELRAATYGRGAWSVVTGYFQPKPTNIWIHGPNFMPDPSQPFPITGTLMSDTTLSGEAVWLERSNDKIYFEKVASTTTDEHGVYTFWPSEKDVGLYYYRVTYPGSEKYYSTSSNTVTVDILLGLGKALDNTKLTWITGGPAYWFGITKIKNYGIGSAQSGSISDGHESFLMTEVEGPGVLQFMWKVSSEKNGDWLQFAIDGKLKDQISGEVPFNQKTYQIGPGKHYLTWSYSKNSAASNGADAGWVDKVEWTSTKSLADALDTTNLVWQTVGETLWFAQNFTSYYEGDAAQSGNISLGSNISLGNNTSILTNITGPGTLKFYWKVSSKSFHGNLSFMDNFNLQRQIAGDVDWAQETYAVGIGEHQLKWSYYEEPGSGSGGVNAGWLDKVEWTSEQSLGEALDNTNLTWSTDGDALWFAQNATSYYDGDSAQSGYIKSTQSTTLNTTVSGPGMLTFWWKVSSLPNYNYLGFYVDSSLIENISGEVDWTQRTVTLDEGPHRLEWRYWKQENVDKGPDAGWVDKVEWTENRP